jgi:hypothetical protein
VTVESAVAIGADGERSLAAAGFDGALAAAAKAKGARTSETTNASNTHEEARRLMARKHIRRAALEKPKLPRLKTRVRKKLWGGLYARHFVRSIRWRA